MNVRLKFSKTGPLRFVGHLDLMRTFQKNIRRSGLPIAYSEGFNPHQILSFATALAVGVTSDGEYMEMRLTEEVPMEDIIHSLNQTAPSGIVYTKGMVMDSDTKKAMGIVSAATYQVTFDGDILDIAIVDAMMALDTLIIQKKNKRGKINDFDLRPGIYACTYENCQLTMTLATGSSYNIRPEMVLDYLMKTADVSLKPGEYKLHRIELYETIDEQLVPLIP